jgi:hypothetical protein
MESLQWSETWYNDVTYGSIQDEQFLDQLNDCQLLKEWIHKKRGGRNQFNTVTVPVSPHMKRAH